MEQDEVNATSRELIIYPAIVCLLSLSVHERSHVVDNTVQLSAKSNARDVAIASLYIPKINTKNP